MLCSGWSALHGVNPNKKRVKGGAQDFPVKTGEVIHALNGNGLSKVWVWGGRFKHSAHHDNINQNENQKALIFIRKPNMHLTVCNHLRVFERVFMRIALMFILLTLCPLFLFECLFVVWCVGDLKCSFLLFMKLPVLTPRDF